MEMESRHLVLDGPLGRYPVSVASRSRQSFLEHFGQVAEPAYLTVSLSGDTCLDIQGFTNFTTAHVFT